MPSITAHSSNNNGVVLSELLTCANCHNTFSSDSPPLNLACGHAVCQKCVLTDSEITCVIDQSSFESSSLANLPLNLALLSILDLEIESFAKKRSLKAYADSHRLADADVYASVENGLIQLAKIFSSNASASSACVIKTQADDAGRDGDGVVEAQRDMLSRALQRKLSAVLTTQLVGTSEGLTQIFRLLRGVVERVLTELILTLQNSINISSHLWSAVRVRGCQFLGAVIQEDVLKLILSALSHGELIARKTLVMYIVDALTGIYPCISKTCVGHVVQLAYRASCFNVIKRDGESSLMQLKEEFRNYDSLRREHDSQIVQIALEAGLRISPEQWSLLLYGDLRHRNQMQNIVDRISSPQLLTNAASELKNVIANQQQSAGVEDGSNSDLHNIFHHLDNLKTDDEKLAVNVKFLDETIADANAILSIYVNFMKNRTNNRVIIVEKKTKKIDFRAPVNGLSKYKTRPCREVSLGRTCPRGENCTYAHGFNELRITNKGLSNRENYSFNAGGFDGMLSTAGNMLSMTTIGSGGAGFLTGSLSATNVPSSTMLIDANAAPSAAAALMAAQRAVQIPTVVPPTNIPSPSDPTAITTLIAVPPNVDATAGALIPAAAAAGPAPSIVNAIDSTTGEIVNLIPVQNVVAQPTVTAVERVNNMPGNFAMESISLVPAVLMPSQPASFAGDSIIEQQMQQAPNILLLNQPGLIQLRPDTVSDVAAACNSSILLMPPNVQQIPAGFPIPMGAIPIRPPVQANVVVGSLSAVHPNPASPPSAIIPGLMMGTQQNFWTNDSCAKFDSGDESFFAKLSAISQPFSSTIYGHIDNDVNKNPFSVENNFENQYSSRRRSFGVNTIEHNTVQDKSDLLIRRHEIISHLAEIRPSSKILEDFFDDELENHVSYTVANSVLFDEKESYFNSGIDLPPLPVGSFKVLEKKSSAPFLYNTLSTNFTNNAKNSSPAAKSSTYLRTACANTLPLNISASMATVQSGCKNVVKDAIEQPLIVSSLQSINFFPQIGDESLNPTRLAEKLPPVIKPLSDRAVSDPQDLVAHSIDRIIDVKERIKDSSICNGVIASAVEKEQLKVELGIANRQITTLDEKTKESCLLKELQVVEKQIENLSIVA